MKKSLVRCWEVTNRNNDSSNKHILYITYPEAHLGHKLITCLVCGHIYSVIVEAELYIEPVEEKVKNLKCVECGTVLSGNYAQYPDTYLYNGKIIKYERDEIPPPDEESVVVEFDELYNK